MTKQTINVGAAANDGTGDTERAAWIKANANFDELYGTLGVGGYASGAWLRPIPVSLVATTVAANVLYAVPFFVAAPVTIQALGVRVATGVSSTNVKLGIYSNVNGRPGAKLAEIASPASTATSSSNATAALASNITLQPGWYWLASIYDGAPQVHGIASATDLFTTFLIGATAMDIAMSASGLTTGVTGTGATYAGGLPASFGAATLRASANTSCPSAQLA